MHALHALWGVSEHKREWAFSQQQIQLATALQQIQLATDSYLGSLRFLGVSNAYDVAHALSLSSMISDSSTHTLQRRLSCRSHSLLGRTELEEQQRHELVQSRLHHVWCRRYARLQRSQG